MTSKTPDIRIGTSGYQYDHWRGRFYPDKLNKNEWFKYYCNHFSTVEINNTFYNLPKKETFAGWREEAPGDFRFSLKLSRYVSHMKKLKDPEEPVANFEDAASSLGSTLGPILVQLPPNWTVNPSRLDDFLRQRKRHRYTVEFRHPSWLTDDIFEVLRKNGAALCIHDMLPDHPDLATADWVYYRFHGKDYGGNYSHQKLSAIADKLADHAKAGCDVYAYFNNDLEGHAVFNAADLHRYVERRRQSA